MEFKHQITEGNKLMLNVFEKCWREESYKEELINKPFEILQNTLNIDLSALKGKEINVEDQSDTSYIYFNIPKKKTINDMELTDEQLELVAGGETIALGILLGLELAALAYGIGYAAGL